MVETIQKRTFGLSGLQFCLEIRSREGGDRKFILTKNGERLKGPNVEPQTLKVLECLTRYTQVTAARKTILEEVWGEKAAASGELDPGGNIDRHISRLRDVFDDDADPEKSRFIKTEQRHGLMFLRPVETVTETISLSPPNTAQVRGVLNVLKKHPCHRYHLTLDKQGEPVWIYTLIDFTKSDTGHGLEASAPVLLEANATDVDRDMNMYDFEAIPYGSHLLIKSRRTDGTSDMCVDLYPHAATHKLPFCGARINDTFFRTTVASSVSILSIGSPLKEFDGVRFDDVREGPVDEQHTAKLRTMWEQRNEVVRLPPDWPVSLHQHPPNQARVSHDPRDLFKVDEPYYHYHLTLNKERDPVWICKIIKFQIDKYGRLFAHTPILPFRGAEPSENMYEIIPTFHGKHLVIQVNRLGSGSDADITVQLFPDAESTKFPSLYCATINRTQTDTFVSSIAILSTKPVGGEILGPVDKGHAVKLLTAWENHKKTGGTEIVRLPLASDRALIVSSEETEKVTIRQKWDESAVHEMLRNSPLNADIRIFTSFFVTNVDLFAVLLDVLTEPNNTRKISVMMLDPDAPVLEMRYGTEEKPIRPSLSAPDARADILNQLRRLDGQAKTLQRRADEADRDKRPRHTGTLEVRLYGCAPTLVSFATPDQMIVGMLLLHATANKGPMIRVPKSEPTEPMWDLVEKNWETVLGLSKQRIFAPRAPDAQ